MHNLSGKKILVIGATGGIGSAIVRTLGKHKAHIIAAGRNQQSLLKLGQRIEAKTPLKIMPVDLLKPASIARLLQKIKLEKPPINYVIFSAGWIDQKKPIAKITAKEIAKTFQINFFSFLRIAQVIAPHLQKKGGFITIASTAGLRPSPQYAAYAASKAALINFSQALAMALQPQNKFCICICPGPTNTAMRQKLAGDAAQHQNPSVVAELILKILREKTKIKNGDMVTIRSGISRAVSRLN